MFEKYDIFLSYSRADAERVKPLRDEFRRMGYRVFFDVQSIDPGERWKTRLDRAIRASRTLVLCWSEHTRGSDFVTFEYSRAEALHKPVFPWLLDATPLPAMLEIQGISAADPTEVAAILRPRLGRSMPYRWTAQAALALSLAIVLAFVLWKRAHPAPWEFSARVVDSQTSIGLPGVTVIVFDSNQHELATAATDSTGEYHLTLPQPQPDLIHLKFTRPEYAGEETDLASRKPVDWPLVKITPVH